MPRVGFEPTISTDERPKTYALDRAATGIGFINTETENNSLGLYEPRTLNWGVAELRNFG